MKPTHFDKENYILKYF